MSHAEPMPRNAAKCSCGHTAGSPYPDPARRGPSIYFRNFAFDRVGTLWQCRAGERLLNLSGSEIVAKPEWGSKRICPSCGARYYDLLREPVICPKCATPFDAEAFLKSRRSRPAPPVEKELEPVGADEIDAEVETEEEAEAVEEEEH